MSKRRKKQQMRNRLNDSNGEGLDKVNGAKPVEAQQERIPATEQTWNAVQLHELRAENCDLQTKVLARDQTIIQKDQIILALRQQLLAHETKALGAVREKADELNNKLRDDHNIRVGDNLHKDDETGDVYWLVNKPKA